MRTYSKARNKRHSDTCRLCLSIMDHGISIFDDSSKLVCDVIYCCLDITVMKDDGLPSTICKECFNFLLNLKLFKNKCKTADEWLRKQNDASSLDASNIDLESSKKPETHLETIDLEVNKDESDEPDILDQTTMPLTEERQFSIYDKLHDTYSERRDADPHVVFVGEITEQSPSREYQQLDIVAVIPKTSDETPHQKTKARGDSLDETVCPYCKKAFATVHSMLRHQSTHTGEKKYKCCQCGAKFSQAGILSRHSLTHTNIRPWSCEFCGKTFIQKGNLKAHMRVHLDNDSVSFPCTICKKVFKFSSGLSRHSLQHKGVRYHCDICPTVLNDQSSFKRHKKIHGEGEDKI